MKIDENLYYKVLWETYVVTADDDTEIKFIPSRMTNKREDKYETLHKVIIPKNIVNNFDVYLAMGNHDLIFKNPQEKITPSILSDLRIAHFPLRSIEQCMSKILVGWPNLIKKNKENNNWGYHWKSFFGKIKQKGSIDFEDLEFFSKNYSLREYPEDIKITHKRMNIDFCEGLEIKYDYDYNYLRNILDNYVYFIEEFLSSQKEISELKKKNEAYKKEIDLLKSSPED